MAPACLPSLISHIHPSHPTPCLWPFLLGSSHKEYFTVPGACWAFSCLCALYKFFLLSPPSKLLLCFQGPAPCWLLQVFSNAPKVTGIPHFSKVCFHHFVFTEDPPQYLFLLTKGNPKGIFTFTKQGKKQKQHSEFVLQPAVEAACTQSGTVRVAWPSSFPGNSTQHLSIKPP